MAKQTAGSAKRKSTKGAVVRNDLIKKKKKAEHADEIAGVILIAVGIVLGIFTYTKTAAVMTTVVKWLFGLMGISAYAMPVLLVFLGAAMIAIPNRQFGTGATSMLLAAVYCISCIIQLSVSAIGSASFAEYVSAAWSLGTQYRRGGGALASAAAFGMAKLFSKAGAIVLFVAAAIALLMLVTRVSIRSAGKKVIAKVDAIEDRRRAKAYNEQLRREEEEANAVMFAANNVLQEMGTKPKKTKRKQEPNSIEPVLPAFAPLENEKESLSFLPLSGTLPKRQEGDETELKSTDVQSAVRGIGAEGRTAADPFATIEIVPEDNITGEIVFSDQNGEPQVEKRKSSGAAEKQKGQQDDAEQLEGLDQPQPAAVYQRPPISLLRQPDHSEAIAGESPADKGKLLIETLASFGIQARITNISVGPVITRFELQPAQGVRVNRITSLSNDIALALAASRVRIEAPIPGKAAIGVEIPNKDTAMVRLREVIDTKEFNNASSPLTMALGKDIAGKPVMADLERMPHMLIAGATGSGKSVCINGIILSLVYKSSPDDVRMILIDPKVVELSIFAALPHLYCPVVTDPKKAAGVLKWAVLEMEQRYAKMGKINARDLARYNALQEKPEDKLPRLVVVIDELADLMMVSSKEVEDAICRIAQLGRACGIHLIVATQRPSVEVITGLIKTNIPSRIAFAVSAATDSRVILDCGGAEKLLGRGDMLFHANGAAKPIRAQGAFVGDEEVEKIMQFFIDNGTALQKDEKELPVIPEFGTSTGQGNGKQEDDLLPDAVRIVMDSGSASISMIQRRLRVGYARAARLVDIMEQKKIVSGFDGSKPRKVLIDEAGYASMFGGAAYGEIDEPDDDTEDIPFEE